MAGTSRTPSTELTPVPAQEPGTPGFFDGIKDVVGNASFEREFGLLAVERSSNANSLTGGKCSDGWWPGDFPPDRAFMEGKLSTSQSKHGVLLIEEINKPWFEFLDSTFGLDPLFVLAYVRGRDLSPSELQHELKQPLVDSGKFTRGVKKKWCVIGGSGSRLKPRDYEDLEQYDLSSYWRQRMRQEPHGALKSTAAFCHLSPSVCERKYRPSHHEHDH
jgi:hypothetical protein